MAWDIEFTDEFGEWFRNLDDAEKVSVTASVDLLEELGPALGRPQVDTLKGLRVPTMKELRVTQTELAEKLHKTQTAVSQLESRSDWHLSTLREYVKALGGEVEIRAVFPQRTIRLTHAAQLGRKAARRT